MKTLKSLFLSLAFLFFFSAVNAAEEPVILRIGAVGDVHNVKDPAFRKALLMLKEKKIDVLMNSGDYLSLWNTQEIADYWKLFHEIFPENAPIHVTVPGNHEYWRKPERCPADETLRDFNAAMGDPNEYVLKWEIKGYTFIRISMEDQKGCWQLTNKTLIPFRKYLAEAEKAHPGRPVFVLSHIPPQDTVYGSAGSGGCVRSALKDHPQVISFSGHIHAPLSDERAIWQGNFTAITTSTFHNLSVPENVANTETRWRHLYRGKEGDEFLYMELREHSLTVYRYTAHTGKEISPAYRWVIPLPFDPATAPYTREKRAAVRKAPEFPAGAKAAIRFSEDGAFVRMDAAKHDNFVHHYKITVKPENGKPVTLLYLTDFYLGMEEMNPAPEYRLAPELFPENAKGTIEIVPVESFGKEGKPLVLSYGVPAPFPPKQEPASRR